jgi:hypothetical protein
MGILSNVIFFVMLGGPATVFDFSQQGGLAGWYVIDDVVMGGRSDGRIHLNEEGNAVFSGRVSLENNGGFSSVRYRFDPLPVQDFNGFEIRVRGDGKRYQFRVKSAQQERASYISYFETSGQWENIVIPFADMYPSYRGFRLNQPNYPGLVMQEIAFLIGNEMAEGFSLEIDFIKLH